MCYYLRHGALPTNSAILALKKYKSIINELFVVLSNRMCDCWLLKVWEQLRIQSQVIFYPKTYMLLNLILLTILFYRKVKPWRKRNKISFYSLLYFIHVLIKMLHQDIPLFCSWSTNYPSPFFWVFVFFLILAAAGP